MIFSRRTLGRVFGATWIVLGTAAFATDGTYTGGGGSLASPLAWTENGNYNGILMSSWKDGYVAGAGGALTIAGQAVLKPPAGLSLASVCVANPNTAGLAGNGFTLAGAAPEMTVVDKGTLQIAANAPVAGTGALTFRTAPCGIGFGSGAGVFELYNAFTGFSSLELVSGMINGRYNDADQTFLTRGAIRLTGAGVTYVANGSGANTAFAATDTGAAFTFAPGFSFLRVARTGGTSATLTVGPIVREAGATAQIRGIGNTTGTLGASEFVKTTGDTAAFTHNGFWDPWLVTYGDNDHASNTDFARYDAAKGFVTASDLYTANTFATTDEKPIANLSGNVTLSADAAVKGLRLVSTDTSGLGTFTFANDATLTVGDGTNPAALVLNYSNVSGNNSGLVFKGSGSIDFGGSEALVWCSVRDQDARRYLYMQVPLKGRKGLTFASPVQNNTGRGPIVQLSQIPQFAGDLHLRGVRLNVSDAKYLAFPAIHVDGSATTRSAQLTTGAVTITNRLYVSGNGFANSSDLPGALYGPATYTARVTLTGDATLMGSATFRKPIDGTGDVTFVSQNDNGGLKATLCATNTYRGATYVQSLVYGGTTYPFTLDLADGATFGDGPVHVLADATVRLAGGTRTITNTVSGAGTLALADAAVATFTSTVAVSRVNVQAGTTLCVRELDVTSVTGGGTIAAAPGVNATVVIDSDADQTLGAVFADGAGTLRLVKRGKGTLRLAPGQAFTGGLAIEDGKVIPLRAFEEPPADGRVFWLDATQTSTLTLDGDNAVTQWCDASGNGVSFGAYGGTHANPTWTASGINGKASVTFSASAKARLKGSNAALYRTLFIVSRTQEGIITCAGLVGQAGQDRNGLRAADWYGHGLQWEIATGYADFCYGTSPVINGTAGYYALDYGKPQVIVLQKITLPSDRNNNITLSLGGYASQTDRNYNGDVAEVIAYDRVLSADERKLVENYLAEKWENTSFHTPPAPLAASCPVTLGSEGVLDLRGADLAVARVDGAGVVTNSDAAATFSVARGHGFTGVVAGPVTLSLQDATAAAVSLAGGARLAVVSGSSTLSAYNETLPVDGLVCWMDAADAATVTTNANGEVTSWASKVGSMTFAADGSLPKPVYQPTGLDGNKPALYYSGSGRMRLASSATLTPATTFLVWHATAAGVDKSTSGGVYGYMNVDAGLRYWSSKTLQYCYTCSPFSPLDDCRGNGVALAKDNYGCTTAASVFAADKTHLISAMAAPGRSLNTRYYVLGSYHGNDARSFIGWICELVVYNRRLSEAERVQVENHLMAKWRRADAIPAARTALGGAVQVAAGAQATVPDGTVVAGAGSVTGDVTLDTPYVVTADAAGTVPCLTVNGAVTIPSGAALELANAAALPGGVFQDFIRATSITGDFASFTPGKPCFFRVRGTTARVGKNAGLLLLIK